MEWTDTGAGAIALLYNLRLAGSPPFAQITVRENGRWTVHTYYETTGGQSTGLKAAKQDAEHAARRMLEIHNAGRRARQ